MATVQADDILDLVKGTQRDLGKFKWTDLTTDTQEFYVLPKILQKEKIVFGTGYGVEFSVMTDHGHQARHKGLWATDLVSVPDVMIRGNVPFRHTDTNWAIEEHEITMNTGAAQIYDLSKVRKMGSMISLAVLVEDGWWGETPDDNLTPFSVKYWIPQSATAAVGQNGTNPANFSSGAANISSTTYPRWANWTGTYAAITFDDLIRSMRELYYRTDFRFPIPGTPSYGTGHNFAIYCEWSVLRAMEDLIGTQNDNLGMDLAAVDGQTVFRGTPINPVKQLEEDSNDPIYFINWNHMGIAFLQDWYLKEYPLKRVDGQHTTMRAYVDMSWNTICFDRRTQGVLRAA